MTNQSRGVSERYDFNQIVNTRKSLPSQFNFPQEDEEDIKEIQCTKCQNSTQLLVKRVKYPKFG